MKTEIKITVPEGMEIDKENSTFECIKFKPKQLTYNDICKKMFSNNKTYYWINTFGTPSVAYYNQDVNYDQNTMVSAHQVKKLMAINKLYNIAQYLNSQYDVYEYWIICIDENQEISLTQLISTKLVGTNPVFNCYTAAQEAIKILGEDVIKLALSPL